MHVRNVRAALGCTVALFALPLLSGCGGDSSSDVGGASDSGSQIGEDSGIDSGAPIAVSEDAGSDAGAGGGHKGDGGGGTTQDAGPPTGNGVVDAAPDVGTVATPDTKVVMYLPNWSGSYADWAGNIDFNKMTHLLLAFGTVDGSNNWDMGASDSDVQTLAAAAHAAGVKILVSIGGASDDIGILNQYASASNIAPMVSNLSDLVNRLNLDGVDVDLERGAMMKSSSNYPAFVKALIAAFRPNGLLVTTALAQYIAQDADSDATLIAVYQSFDFINDMIYTTNAKDFTDEASWWTGTEKIDPTKLVWGIEFTKSLSASLATQLTTSSKAYGGIMIWEYSQPTESTLWPAVQSAL